ncbi:hypothetical protein OSTOST_03417 [Ostertagia ostertagi]
MLQSVLAITGFYFSYSVDLSRSLQWLSENGTPSFKQMPMIDRADARFVWNSYLLSQLRSVQGIARFALPVIHGFYGEVHHCVNGNQFKLSLISRRSRYRAGVRFYKRGVSSDGHPANFVETEQIVETISGKGRRLTSFLQTRGSIPLLWSQRPNLKWQPMPTMKPSDDQLSAYMKHFENQKKTYGGQHVIVNLVNQTGREKKIGAELERIIQQANLSYVRFFAASTELTDTDLVQRSQIGFFRTNCMDCLDRTNVVQAMIARESLTDQLTYLGILIGGQRVETLWADNGDECSRQYAGTGALKADFTRLGKRTYTGAINDGINAITRYFRNNFADGYRQDAMDVFLGNFVIDVHNLPSSLEATLISLDQNGIALLAACFAMAMTILCVLVAENISATLFWLAVFLICMMFIFINGEEFVNAPKLKQD